MTEQNEQLVKNDALSTFVQTVEPDIGSAVEKRTDLLPEEIEAGGEVESLNLSKMFKNRLILSSGADGQFVIKDQVTDEKRWSGDKLQLVILHGHHTYKLKEFMISRPDVKLSSLSDEEKKVMNKVIAMSYDLPKVSKGNFRLAGKEAYLTNPSLFDIVKKYGRINMYALLPNKEVDGPIFISFASAGATRFDGLIKAKNQLPLPVLPYYLVEFTHEEAKSQNGEKYRKPVMEFAKDESGNPIQYAPIELLREKILPLSKKIQEMHKLAKEQLEMGMNNEYDEEEKVVSDEIAPF